MLNEKEALERLVKIQEKYRVIEEHTRNISQTESYLDIEDVVRGLDELKEEAKTSN